MKTKKFFALLLALAMLLALAACGNAPADTNETNTNTGAKRKLVVANWQSYATDSDYGAAHFAELYDCEVEHYFLSSIPELLSVLENGGVGQIDVVCINPLYLQQYLNAGVLDTIDTSALENYNNLREDFRTIDEVKDENGVIIMKDDVTKVSISKKAMTGSDELAGAELGLGHNLSLLQRGCHHRRDHKLVRSLESPVCR